jgi:hypothetical protein
MTARFTLTLSSTEEARARRKRWQLDKKVEADRIERFDLLRREILMEMTRALPL